MKDCRVWLPSKDTGVDLLVTDKNHRNGVSLQIKFSKDFMVRDFRAIGWWTLKPQKIASSLADLWVVVLYSFEGRQIHYVVIPPQRLFEILQGLHGAKQSIHTYICVGNNGQCWEARGLSKEEIQLVATGEYSNAARDLTEYLDNWAPLKS